MTMSHVTDALALQLIKEGSTKLASVPSGVGGGAAAPAAGGAAPAAAEEAKAEEKEEGSLSKSPYSKYVVHELTKATIQRRRSPTKTWASVSSTRRLSTTHESRQTSATCSGMVFAKRARALACHGCKRSPGTVVAHFQRHLGNCRTIEKMKCR